MTAIQRFSRERIGRSYIASKWDGTQLPHKCAFDVQNHTVLFEVKTVGCRERNPKVHIETQAYWRKQQYDGRRFTAILAVVQVDDLGNVVEARYDAIKQHVRFHALMSEANFSEAMAIWS